MILMVDLFEAGHSESVPCCETVPTTVIWAIRLNQLGQVNKIVQVTQSLAIVISEFVLGEFNLDSKVEKVSR